MVETSPSNAAGEGLIPGQGAKIPHALCPKNQSIKQKQYCNKFNKDFKNGPHQKKIFFFKKEADLGYWKMRGHVECNSIFIANSKRCK